MAEYVPHWATPCHAPPAAAAATARVWAGPVHADIAADSVDDLPAVALAERVGDFNISMDPWEQTGAAPQGWAAHAHQTVIPVQGYIQLRPQDTTLPSFGSGPPATVATADENLSTEVAVRDGGGKASPSVTVCAHGSRAFNRYKAAAPPLPISPMKSLPTRDTLDQMTMTTLTGWPLNYRMEVTLCVSCSLFDLQRLRRPEEMQPLSVLFPGLATNSTQSWNSSSRRQWSTFPLGQKLKGVKS